MTSTNRHAARTAVVGFALLGTLSACTAEAEETTATEKTDQTASVAAAESETATASTASYTDGTYTVTGSYVSPGGQEEIEVTITLSDDTITAVEVTPQATNSNSAQYQKQFQSGIAAEVVGKDIDEINVSRVSGSSLASQGFNDAVEQIKDAAR